jgi:hypothetical protein
MTTDQIFFRGLPFTIIDQRNELNRTSINPSLAKNKRVHPFCHATLAKRSAPILLDQHLSAHYDE